MRTVGGNDAVQVLPSFEGSCVPRFGQSTLGWTLIWFALGQDGLHTP